MAAAGKDLLRLALALCTCVLLGCGSGPAAGRDDRTADTARVELVITRSDREGQLVLSGSHDYVRERGSVTVKLEGTEDAETDTPTEVRYFGERFYREMPWAGRTYWVSETEESGIGHLDQVIVPFVGGELDPRAALRVILDAGNEEQLGQEELRGAATTHYRVRLEPDDVRRELDGRPLDEAAGPLTTEVWGDDAKRLRRIRLIEETATLTYDFFDFGVEVDVERPPEEKIVTAAEFDRITKVGR